jgi:hypothetical protein
MIGSMATIHIPGIGPATVSVQELLELQEAMTAKANSHHSPAPSPAARPSAPAAAISDAKSAHDRAIAFLRTLNANYPDATPSAELLELFGIEDGKTLGPVLRPVNKEIASRGFNVEAVYTRTRSPEGRQYLPGPHLQQCLSLLEIF